MWQNRRAGVTRPVHEGTGTQSTRDVTLGSPLGGWLNEAEVLNDRLSLMLRTGASGFVLVFIVLTLFLELRLAFWVSLGIPISFLGAIAMMPSLDVSANVISLFAFTLVLGIVVDDAIIVGENIHRHQEEHGEGLRAAIEGAREIAKPVTFAVLTTVAAFTPMMFVPGMMGKIDRCSPRRPLQADCPETCGGWAPIARPMRPVFR